MRVRNGNCSGKGPLLAALLFASGLLLLVPGCGFITGAAAYLGVAVSEGGSDEERPPAIAGVQPVRVSALEPFELTVTGEGFVRPLRAWLQSEKGECRLEAFEIEPVESNWFRARFNPRFSADNCTGPFSLILEVGGLRIARRNAVFISAVPVSTARASLSFAGGYQEVVSDPRSMVTVDLDGAGCADEIAVAGGTSRQVQFLRLHGDGHAEVLGSVDTQEEALSLTVLDKGTVGKFAAASGDGAATAGEGVAVATRTGVLVIYLDGNGAFRARWSPIDLDPPEGRRFIAAGDFDAESTASGERLCDDLVIATEDEEEILLFFDFGLSGEVLRFRPPSVDPQVRDIAVVDLNLDGYDELVTVSKSRGRLDYYLNCAAEGGGRKLVYLREKAAGKGPEALAVGNLWDFQFWDEYPDVVVTKGADEVKAVFTEGFQQSETGITLLLGSASRSVAMGYDAEDIMFVDLGGPQRCNPKNPAECHPVPDIVSANLDSQDVSYAITPETDLGTPITIPVQGSPVCLASGDFDCDGDKDVVVLSLNGSITILINMGPPADPVLVVPFSTAPILRPAPAGIARSDLDGDDWPDYFVPCRYSGEMAAILSRGGTYDRMVFQELPEKEVYSVCCADVDGDGASDAVVGIGVPPAIYVLYRDPGSSLIFSARDFFDLRSAVGGLCMSRGLAVADIDGDGDMDLAVALTIKGAVALLWNLKVGESEAAFPRLRGSRSLFAVQVLPDIGPDPRRLDLKDVDGDGDLDLLVACESLKSSQGFEQGKAWVFWNDGQGSFTLSGSERLAAWGAITVEEGIWQNPLVISALADDDIEFITACRLGGRRGGLMDLVAANSDLISYYPGIEVRGEARKSWGHLWAKPRWIPVDPREYPDECTEGEDQADRSVDLNGDGLTDRFCPVPDSSGDPEFVYPFDINGDGLLDLAVSDEERNGVFLLLDKGAGEDPQKPWWLSSRFALTHKVPARGPQACDLFERAGSVFLAIVNRATMSLAVHHITEGGGNSEPVAVTPLYRERELGPDGVSVRGGLAAFIRAQRPLISFARTKDLGALPGSAWLTQYGALQLEPGWEPVAVLLRSRGSEETSFDLVVAQRKCTEEGFAGQRNACEQALLELLVLGPVREDELPERGLSVPVDLIAQRWATTTFAFGRSAGWVCLKQDDIGSLGGAADGVADVVAATDRGVWVLFGAQAGLAPPVRLLAEGGRIVDVALGKLNADEETDLAVLLRRDEKLRVLFAFGPFGSADPLWKETAISPEGRTACIAIGPAPVAGSKKGVLLVASDSQRIDAFTARRDERVEFDQSFGLLSSQAVNPVDMAFGDLDGDSLTDLVVADGESDSIFVFAAQGDGSYQPLGRYFAGPGVAGVRVLDLNGDGLDDLLVLDSRSGLNVKLNMTVQLEVTPHGLKPREPGRPQTQ